MACRWANETSVSWNSERWLFRKIYGGRAGDSRICTPFPIYIRTVRQKLVNTAFGFSNSWAIFHETLPPKGGPSLQNCKLGKTRDLENWETTAHKLFIYQDGAHSGLLSILFSQGNHFLGKIWIIEEEDPMNTKNIKWTGTKFEFSEFSPLPFLCSCFLCPLPQKKGACAIGAEQIVLQNLSFFFELFFSLGE